MADTKILTKEAGYYIILKLIYYAAVVESADTRDLKSLDGNIVPVQVRSAAPKQETEFDTFCIEISFLFFMCSIIVRFLLSIYRFERRVLKGKTG